MSTPMTKARERLEMQGFTGLTDDQIRQLGPWLRFAPAACMTWAAIATSLAAGTALWTLAVFALLGSVMRNHPFDVVYNHIVRRITGGERLPRYGLPRRIACAVGSVWLIATGLAFHSGLPLVGYLLGYSFVLTAMVQVFLGFCIPSYIVRLLSQQFVRRVPIEQKRSRAH